MTVFPPSPPACRGALRSPFTNCKVRWFRQRDSLPPKVRRRPLTQVAQDISLFPVCPSLLQGTSVSVHVRSSPPLPLHSGSFNISCATCVKAQGRGLDTNVVK